MRNVIALDTIDLAEFLEQIEAEQVPGNAVFVYDYSEGIELEWYDDRPEPPPPVPETKDEWAELVERAWREHRQREKEIADELYTRSLGF